jgi:hypothetical protein
MRMRIRSIFLTGVGAVLAVTLGATSSSAATATWTIKPGGNFSASGKITLTDTSGGAAITCSSRWTGRFKSGHGLPGAGLGMVRGLSLSNCSAAGGLKFTVTARLPWSINGTSYKPGVTKGTITRIHLKLAGAPCSAVMDGTSGSADNGKVTFSYTNRTGQMVLLGSRSNLHFWNIQGCLGLINSGDGGSMTGTLTLSPRQAISSP